jgi:hypothetical protein
MANRPPRDNDSAEVVNRLRVMLWLGPAGVLMLSLAEYKAVGAGPLLMALVVVNIIVVAGIGVLLLRGVDRGARSWVGMVSGAGNIPPAPSFSAQESLIIRGRFAEAEQSFLEWLQDHPGDHDARLALADLYRRHLASPDAAIRLYLEVRQGSPSARQEVTAANQLIDLYRMAGDRGRLMAELARYAERYPGTRAGKDARKALLELKQGGSLTPPG